jgi:hypothetical protein
VAKNTACRIDIRICTAHSAASARNRAAI